MTLQIEAGKYYLTRDGRKVGPMVGPDSDGLFNARDQIDGYIGMWRADGRNEFFVEYKEPQYDLIAEWVDEPAQPAPLDLAALAKQHGIRITVAVGEMSMTYDGRE